MDDQYLPKLNKLQILQNVITNLEYSLLEKYVSN